MAALWGDGTGVGRGRRTAVARHTGLTCEQGTVHGYKGQSTLDYTGTSTNTAQTNALS